MSQPSAESQGVRQVLINDVDCTSFAISTQVELNENGIPMATLIAENEDAKQFLSTLVIGDTVEVKGLADSPEGYYAENLVNWAAVLPCFVGTIQELTPDLSSSGQVTGVMCLGVGFQLKTMKVNAWYGDITALVQIANVAYIPSNFVSTGWSFGGYEQAPYIACYSGEQSLVGSFQGANANYIYVGGNNEALYIGGFGFALNEDYDYNPFSYCKLHVVSGLYANSAGAISNAVLTPQWSIDGINWNNFTGNNGTANRIGAGAGTQTYNTLNGSFPPCEVSVSSLGPPFSLIYWLIGGSWTLGSGDDTYNPLADYIHGTPKGEDDYLDITDDMNAMGGFNHNLQIRIALTSTQTSAGTPADSGISVIYMYLEYEFNQFYGLTARQLLAGDAVTKGIIPNYINKVFNGVKDSLGNDIPTGYPAIGTDYIIYDTPSTFTQIPALTLPYNDGFQAINDVLRYSSGLRLLNYQAGLHWRLDTLGNLLVAPVDNHSVNGIDGSHVVDSVPNTIQWNLRRYSSPIVVKQSMITQNLKQVLPMANMVLIGGSYLYPQVDQDPCQGFNIISWFPYWVAGDGTFVDSGNHGILSAPNSPVLSSNDPEIAGTCIKFPCLVDAAANLTNVWVYELPADLDFTKLMGRNTTAAISALIKKTGGIAFVQIRLYWTDPFTAGYPDSNGFMFYDITDQLNQNFFVGINIPVPNTKFIKDFKGWSMGKDVGWLNAALGLNSGTPHTIYDIANVHWIGIAVGTNIAPIGPVFVEMSALQISGDVIRGVYDPTNVSGTFTYPPSGNNYGTPVSYSSGFGLRVLTIKNSLLYTNTLDPRILTDYLSLEAIYELERNEIPYTTGEITIPFDPAWLDGQQVWIQAEDVIPLGVGVQSYGSIPATMSPYNFDPTMVSIGTYFVDTATWEVYLCTNISSGTYTWTDQHEVRYKINQWFRILKVIHRFTSKGGTTSLQITNDLFSSFPINSLDSYTTLVRAMNPDFQTHTNGSLKALGDFDLGLIPIITPYTPTF